MNRCFNCFLSFKLNHYPSPSQFIKLSHNFSSSLQFLKKLNKNTLTKKEVQLLIQNKYFTEEKIKQLELKINDIDFQNLKKKNNSKYTSQEKLKDISWFIRQNGTTRNQPLFVERVGEKKWKDLFFNLFFWLIILMIWFYFQANQGGIQNMFDDNYKEYDEIHWKDKIEEERSENKKPLSWRDRILVIFRIKNDDDIQNNKNLQKKQKLITFENVCGSEEVKEDLQDLVHYLKHPEDFRRMGIKLPKGILLEGPPGTGKTFMARALAGEAGVPFLTTNGSAFDHIFVGVGVMRVKNLFERAKQLAPCIIFIDEIDAIGSSRDSNSFSPNSSDSLNALLVELDGFEENNGVIVVAATNIVEKLDHALTRAGRFDRCIQVSLPDRKQRKEIIKMYLKENGDETINIDEMVSDMFGFNCADLANIVNLAGIEAVKEKKEKVSMIV